MLQQLASHVNQNPLFLLPKKLINAGNCGRDKGAF